VSLAIDVDDVTAVLLADGWHEVADASFELDAYEFVWASGGAREDALLMHGGGASDICATGFTFREEGAATEMIAGPLSAVLAVRYERAER
jgi:hypothetical protein